VVFPVLAALADPDWWRVKCIRVSIALLKDVNARNTNSVKSFSGTPVIRRPIVVDLDHDLLIKMID
jgi:hypothetical protein